MSSEKHREFLFGGLEFRGDWLFYQSKSGGPIPAWLLTGATGGQVAIPLDVLEEVFDFFRPEHKSHVTVDSIVLSGETQLGIRVAMPTRNIPRPHSVSNEFYFAHREMPPDDWAMPYCPAALLGDGTVLSIQAGQSPKGRDSYRSEPPENDADFYTLFSALEMSDANGRKVMDGFYIPYDVLDKYIEDHGGIVGTARFGYGSDGPIIVMF